MLNKYNKKFYAPGDEASFDGDSTSVPETVAEAASSGHDSRMEKILKLILDSTGEAIEPRSKRERLLMSIASYLGSLAAMAGGALIVTQQEGSPSPTLDKTWAEINASFPHRPSYIFNPLDTTRLTIIKVAYGYLNSNKKFAVVAQNGSQLLTYYAETEDDYPVLINK